MTILLAGQPLTDFVAQATSNQRVQLSQLKKQRVVFFFYPKNGTPSCIIENQDFAANHSQFLKHNTRVFGISRDTLTSHEQFKSTLNIPFELISDSLGVLCELFDVLHQNPDMGDTFQALKRSTFLIDEQGKLVREWRGVKVRDHVHQVLDAVRKLPAIAESASNQSRG